MLACQFVQLRLSTWGSVQKTGNNSSTVNAVLLETHSIKAKILNFNHILIVWFEAPCGGVQGQIQNVNNVSPATG